MRLQMCLDMFGIIELQQRSAKHRKTTSRWVVAAVWLALLSAPLTPAAAEDAAQASGGNEMTLDVFLDRLMMSESGGKLHAKNPLSTALGPYQFIASTWFMIARKDFTKEIEGLRPDQILALRTEPALARRAAQIYTEQNAAYLVSQGQKATFPNLRLAFLVGPGAALRVLMAGPGRSASDLLGATVIGANPFMANMTAADLIARAARDITANPKSIAGVTPAAAAIQSAGREARTEKPARPRIAVACELSLPSCKRWLALAERRVKRIRRASN